MNYMILRRLNRVNHFKEEAFLIKLIIFMYLISQVTQLSFTYAGLSELFGILLALTNAILKYDILIDYKSINNQENIMTSCLNSPCCARGFSD